MSVDIDIVVEYAAWGAEEPLLHLAQVSADAALAEAGEQRGDVEICVLFADDLRIQGLNAEWRGKDSATNVLSFPNEAPAPDGAPRFLGDIALAYETMAAEAEHGELAFQDHVTHLLVHGILHLVGYDHVRDDDAEIMEATEIAALARLGVANPYDSRPEPNGPIQ